MSRGIRLTPSGKGFVAVVSTAAARDRRIPTTRKEFFHVPLHTIEQEAKKMGATVEFTLLAEAREYRETQQVLSSKMKSQSSSPSQFPSSI